MIKTFFLTSVLFLSLAQAQEDVIKMNSIKVEDDQATTNIDGEAIEQKQAEDLEDTFRQSTDIRVGGARKNAEKIYIRGIEDRSLNITVDGARQSGNLFHHQGRLNVDPEMMKRIEVQAGTGNALSGPGALGGSVKFITKDPEDLLQVGQKYGASIKAGYATNNDEKSGSLALYTKPTDVFSALTYVNTSSSMDNLNGDGDRIPYTRAKPLSLLTKFILQPNDQHKLSLSMNRREDNGERMMRSNFGYTVTQPITDQKFNFTGVTLNYDYTSGNPDLNLHTEITNADQAFESRTATTSEARSNTQSILIQNRFERESLKWYVGTDLYQDTVEGLNSTRTDGKEKGLIYGVFTQVMWSMSPSWWLSSGLRFDQYKLKSMNDQEFNDSGLSPNTTLRYNWSETFSTSMGWAKAFKGSTPIEILLLSGTQSAAPRNNLKATIAETTEIGFNYKYAYSHLHLVLFSTLIQNPQNSAVASNIITRTNGPDIKTEGFTATWSQELSTQWLGTLGYTHTKLRADGVEVGSASGGNHMASGSGDRLNINFDYRLADKNMVASWNSLIVSEFSDVPAGATKQPGYDIHEVNISWLLEPSLKLGFGVYNIFDKTYVAQGTVYQPNSPLYEPGRDFRFTAGYTF